MHGLAAVSKGSAEFLVEGERLQPKVLLLTILSLPSVPVSDVGERERMGQPPLQT